MDRQQTTDHDNGTCSFCKLTNEPKAQVCLNPLFGLFSTQKPNQPNLTLTYKKVNVYQGSLFDQTW